jgi:hypothetical protein
MRFAALILLVVVICACGSSQAVTFTQGELLTAEKLNTAFTEVDTALNKYVQPGEIGHGTSSPPARGTCQACHIGVGISINHAPVVFRENGSLGISEITYIPNVSLIYGLGALPVFTNNTAAIYGGKTAGTVYRTASGQLMIAY